MVPLYGEGENAFIRLQLEILSKTDDESIFACAGRIGGVIARSPKAFKKSGNVERREFDQERPQYSMTRVYA